MTIRFLFGWGKLMHLVVYLYEEVDSSWKKGEFIHLVGCSKSFPQIPRKLARSIRKPSFDFPLVLDSNSSSFRFNTHRSFLSPLRPTHNLLWSLTLSEWRLTLQSRWFAPASFCPQFIHAPHNESKSVKGCNQWAADFFLDKCQRAKVFCWPTGIARIEEIELNLVSSGIGVGQKHNHIRHGRGIGQDLLENGNADFQVRQKRHTI